ncbi:Putative sodium-coupled neutral amino acid transporter 8 [Larimichthys crocea]|uniref:Uncharacterized protein n=1 Tax=Larimichthys crocea TaxID=215358 RepID=A0ACD3QG36_LARCR|nr:Putative sodium-coupled neutral amino acid transporter 8 [Larimichthys crocea]
MENQRLSHWVFISVVSMIFCLVIYSLTGAYGYLTFGKGVKADILMSYTGDDILMLVARLLFGVSIITIYPIILLLGRSVIQDPLLSWRRRREGAVTVDFESHSRYVLTVLWITATLLIAMFVPDISKVISVIGGISAFFIFIFPGLCLMFAMQSEPVSWKTRKRSIERPLSPLFNGITLQSYDEAQVALRRRRIEKNRLHSLRDIQECINRKQYWHF